MIVQAFSNHVNINYEELRNYFVDFDGKKDIKVEYNTDEGKHFFSPKRIPKLYYQDFSNKQTKKWNNI